jgi:hypothetical protein
LEELRRVQNDPLTQALTSFDQYLLAGQYPEAKSLLDSTIYTYGLNPTESYTNMATYLNTNPKFEDVRKAAETSFLPVKISLILESFFPQPLWVRQGYIPANTTAAGSVCIAACIHSCQHGRPFACHTDVPWSFCALTIGSNYEPGYYGSLRVSKQ